MGKILSLIIGFIYVVLVALTRNAEFILTALLWLVIALGCIWYPENIGNYIGPVDGDSGPWQVDKKTPSLIIKIFGWILLLSPVWIIPILYIITAR